MTVSFFRLQGCKLTLQCHGGLVAGSITAEGICLHSGYFLLTLLLGGLNLVLFLLLDLMLLGISFLHIPIDINKSLVYRYYLSIIVNYD